MHKIRFGKNLPYRYCSKFLAALFLFIFITSISSCLNIPSHKPVNIFDIGVPKPIYLPGIELGFIDFLNDSETMQKMLYRTGKNRIEYDPYNKWSALPNRLLSNYLKASFRTKNISSKNIVLNLAGSVSSFQVDLMSRQVSMSVEYRIRHKGTLMKEYSEVVVTKFTEKTPIAFAEAMSRNAKKLAFILAKQMQNIRDNIEQAKKNKSKTDSK
ncbi:MAG: hypothetical protein GY756_15510 [bacterium]|nr:hypothetical protein [bacterium]